MGLFGKRKDGRYYPKHHHSGTSKHTMDSLKKQNEARNKTIHALNYKDGDYIGPNPSRRSIQLDRKKHNKNEPWENR